MKEFFKKKVVPFLISFFSCSFVFFSITWFCFYTKNSIANVQNSYESEPYYSANSSNLNTNILIVISDTQFCFFLNLNSIESKFSINLFTINCVKNSTEVFDTKHIKNSAEDFFGVDINRLITIDSAKFKEFIDLVGGITADIPYGITSPARKDMYIAIDQELHFFGSSVIDLMAAEPFPDTQRMIYYAELVSKVCKKALNNPHDMVLNFIINECKTDISYVDIYDFKDAIILCSENSEFTAHQGVWMNDKFYLH